MFNEFAIGAVAFIAGSLTLVGCGSLDAVERQLTTWDVDANTTWDADANTAYHSGFENASVSVNHAAWESAGWTRKAEGALRLAGTSSTALAGRLEIYHDGAWGTVCDDSFNSADARVVCRQLGLSGGAEVGIGTFGAGTGQVWMDDVGCTGSETRLDLCSHNSWGSHNCNHQEDVGIQCEAREAEGALRLAGTSSTVSAGRLEIYHDGAWGTVCDDSFHSADARVVCRQLGLSGGAAVGIGTFGAGTGQIWMDDVGCTGSETRLDSCSHNSWSHNCNHEEDVGIQCEA